MESRLFFCRRNPQLCRGLWKSAGDGEGVDIPFDAVKARPVSGAKGGRQKGEKWLGAYRLELQLSHPLCAGGVLQRKQAEVGVVKRGADRGVGGRRASQSHTCACKSMWRGADGGQERCGNGWIDLWVAGEDPLANRARLATPGFALGCEATGPAGGWPLTGREKGCTLNLLN